MEIKLSWPFERSWRTSLGGREDPRDKQTPAIRRLVKFPSMVAGADQHLSTQGLARLWTGQAIQLGLPQFLGPWGSTDSRPLRV